MKNYIRPSVEVSKFDVADIITASGVIQSGAALDKETTAGVLYNAYVNAAGSQKLDDVAVFQW